MLDSLSLLVTGSLLVDIVCHWFEHGLLSIPREILIVPTMNGNKIVVKPHFFWTNPYHIVAHTINKMFGLPNPCLMNSWMVNGF